MEETYMKKNEAEARTIVGKEDGPNNEVAVTLGVEDREGVSQSNSGGAKRVTIRWEVKLKRGTTQSFPMVLERRARGAQ